MRGLLVASPFLKAPSGAFFHYLDGVPRAVSGADEERLRGIEAGVRAMLPDMTAIAREAIAITFDALGGVNAALGGKRSDARRFQQMRGDALARVDAMEARGEWSSALFGEEFEAEVEAAAEAMAASFTPTRALWMAVSGGFGRMERRMEKWEARFEQQMAVREAALEHHAAALCGRLEQVQRLQDAMELRLDDGRPLQVIKVSRGVAFDRASQGLPRAGVDGAPSRILKRPQMT